MPKLPTYEQKRNITPQLSAPVRQEVDQKYAPVDNIVNTINTIQSDWLQARAVMETTKASAQYESGRAQIEYEAKNDPNYQNAEEYKKRLDKLKEDTLGIIGNSKARELTGIEIEKNNAISMIKINADFMEKQREQNSIDLEKAVDGLVKNKISAITVSEVETYNEQIDQIIQENILVGNITPEDGIALKRGANLAYVRYEILADQATEEEKSEVYHEIKKGDKGKYAGIKEEDRQQLEQESLSKIKENEKLAKKQVEEFEQVSYEKQFEAMNQFKANIGQKTIGQSIQELDIGKKTGMYPDKWANAEKERILSTAGINTARQNEEEANLIMKIESSQELYMVGSGTTKKKKGKKDMLNYMKSIIELETEISQKAAAGLITEDMASALSKKLYSSKTAQATMDLTKKGFYKYDTTEAFKNVFRNQLNISDSYMAAREFFKRLVIDNKDSYSKEEGSKIALEIVDAIKNDTRNEVLTQNDMELETTVPTYETEEEAIAEGLPKGTVVMIAGRPARIT